MTDKTNGAAVDGGPAGALTDAEKLTALDMYIKALSASASVLRARLTDDFGTRKVEKVGAYLPDGTKIGSVSYRKGAKTARIIDEGAALKWAIKEHPEEIMQAVRPAFLAMLLDLAKKAGYGYDPATGQALDWIEVAEGAAGVTVTTTPEGKARMAALAGGFAAMIEGAKPEPAYDADFADRLENGAYDRG